MTTTLRLRLAAAAVIALSAAASHPASASAGELTFGACTGSDWSVAMAGAWNTCAGMGYCTATLDSCSNDGNGTITWDATCYPCRAQ
jgi:hypothetical protein